MTTTTKVAIAGAVIVGGTLAYLFLSKGESPIEIADSSVKLHYEYGFDVDGPNAIRASNGLRHLKSIDVVDAMSGTRKESIPVKKGWTLSSVNGQVVIKPKDKLVFLQEVPIGTPPGTQIKQTNANNTNDFLYEPSDQSQFTPATLKFDDGDCHGCSACSPNTPGTCSLFCPSGKCKILLQYK